MSPRPRRARVEDIHDLASSMPHVVVGHGPHGNPVYQVGGTTPHFDGHPSVLLRASRTGELTVPELTEVVQDAWLTQASPKRAAAWLNASRSG